MERKELGWKGDQNSSTLPYCGKEGAYDFGECVTLEGEK